MASCVSVGAAAKDQYCESTSESLDTQQLQFRKILEVEPLTEGFAILEGPLWYNGALVMSHIGLPKDGQPNPSNLVRLQDGQLQVLEEGYGGNGMTLDQEGNLVVARHKDGTITQLKSAKILAAKYEGERFNSPNDLVVSAEGHIYFTDPDWQSPKPKPQKDERVYHVDHQGKVRAFGAEIEKPNGVMLSLDERTLFVGGTNGLYTFSVNSKGKIKNTAEKVEAVSGGVDGMSKDCAGNLYVTSDGYIFVLNTQDLSVLAKYNVPGVTNVAFGGADHKTLYATTLGAKPQVWQAKSNVAGFPY